MQRFIRLIASWLGSIKEIMPWDLAERMQANPSLLIVDVREPDEYAYAHIPGALLAPRGILESCCEWNFTETIPELVEAREREIVVVCRSGYRSLLAAKSMEILGYRSVASLKTGLRGWNDYEQALVDADEQLVDSDLADQFFTETVLPAQLEPARRPS
jgi:rhodanese-related sulfurtransferase